MTKGTAEGSGETEGFECCFECGRLFRGDGHEETAAGLGVGEDTTLFVGEDVYFLTVTVPIASRPAGDASLLQVIG